MNDLIQQSINKAKSENLLDLKKAEGDIRLECLASKCALCCRCLGTPIVTSDEIKNIGEENISRTPECCFVKSKDSICSLLKNGLCSIYDYRPSGCREYPWYNIDGELFYDAGCPGIKFDYDDKPDVNTIGPIQRFKGEINY